MGIETQDDESDVEGEVDLKVELVGAIEKLRKSIMKNKESNQIIIYLKTQLREAKKRIQGSEILEAKITILRNKIDEEPLKSKFENNSNTLYDILNSQIPSSDKTRLGYEKRVMLLHL